jgi:glycolate oxidase FAD binding subunit
MGLGTTPKGIDIVLGLRRLNSVVEYDVPNLTVIAQAGVVLEDLQAQFASNQQFLPMDPAFPSAATVGGVIATNASGPRRYAYGAARDLVLGMKVVLANGDLIHPGGKTVKNVAGYDLDKLFIGSMGTLGVIVEVAFRLFPAPERRATIVAAFPTLDTAQAAVTAVLKSQLLPTALEILNAKALEVVGMGQGVYGLALPVEGAREAVERQLADLAGLCGDAGALATETITDQEERALWLAVRDLPGRIALASPDSAWAKCSVLIGGVHKVAQDAVAAAARLGLTVALDVRAGNGIVNAWFQGQQGDEARQAVALNELRAAAAAAGGTMILERAPVKVKQAVSVWGQPGTDFPAMKAIKSRLDPGNVLNPGRYAGGI